MSDILRRLFTETWPAKAAKSALEALMLPGQVAGGQLATQPSTPGMWSDVDEARSQATQQGIGNRATDLASLLMLGSGAVPAGANELRAGIRPYQNVPDQLMGQKRFGPQTPYEAQAYQKEFPVQVVLPKTDVLPQEVMRDMMKGLNADHAVERAYRNWPDAIHINVPR